MQDIVCPSGLRGTIRGLKVREKGFLTDEKLLRTDALVGKILESCWVKTTSLGPAYDFGGEIPSPLPWDEVLQGDRLYALKAIRSATWGREFELDVTCTNMLCKHRFLWVIDMDAVPIKKLGEAEAARIRSGQFFETEVAGKKIVFRPLLGRDAQLVAQLTRRGSSILTAGLAVRVVSVDGVDPEAESIAAWIDDLEAPEGEALQQKLDSVDCGLETSLRIECPQCETSQESLLPLVLSFFVTGRPTNLPRIVARGSRTSSTPSGKPAAAAPGSPGAM
jgi:hypothetical protein